jgi:hypothetical protein
MQQDNNIPLATLITVCVTLGLFVLNQLIGVYTAYSKRSTQRMLVRLNHLKLIREVNKQAKQSKDTSNYIDWYNSIRVPLLWDTTSVQAIHQIGYEGTFNIFFTGFENIFALNQNDKVVAFRKLWAIIERIQYEAARLEAMYLQMDNEFAGIKEEQKDLLSQILAIIEKFALISHRKYKPGSPMRLYTTQLKVIKNKFRNVYSSAMIAGLFCDSVQYLNRNYRKTIGRYEDDLRGSELNLLCTKYRLESSYYSERLSGYENHFLRMYEKHRELSKSLCEIYRVLNNKPYKQ